MLSEPAGIHRLVALRGALAVQALKICAINATHCGISYDMRKKQARFAEQLSTKRPLHAAGSWCRRPAAGTAGLPGGPCRSLRAVARLPPPINAGTARSEALRPLLRHGRAPLARWHPPSPFSAPGRCLNNA